MKKLLALFLIIFAELVQGCEFMGDVFRTGLYSGIFLVVLIVVAIIFTIISLSRKK